MFKTKWFMKQYWRVGTMRALASLGLSMLVLGRWYYVYIPVLSDLDLWGALILGFLFIFAFLGIGWYYDEKARMWSQKLQVTVERDPYRYVPNYRSFAIDFPVDYVVFSTLKSLFQEEGLVATEIHEFIRYLHDYYVRRPEKPDIERAGPQAEEYMDNHPFAEEEEDQDETGLVAKLKYGFELRLLQLSWVQELTGIFQEVLVFGAFYVTILFPGVTQNNRVPLGYLLLGLILLSFPLLVGVTLLGWFYDRKLKVWSADTVVRVERNPFYYVPPPRYYILDFPFLYAVFKTLGQILEAEGIDNTMVNRVLGYLMEYGKLRVSENEDILRAKELRDSMGVLFQTRLLDG